ncbi:hypothetical protein FRC00_004587 [Tulasnella sp. 408]|nr:hypothetical protein FRC00_004587 [Tulasnella sp. 408]
MPPKKGKGKGKKFDDDEIWDKMGESAPSTSITSPAAAEDDEDTSFGGAKSQSRKGGFASGFAGLSLEDTTGGGAEEEEEDFGGLMVRLETFVALSAIKSTQTKTTKKDKKKKDKKKGWDDYDALLDDQQEPAQEEAAPQAAPSAPQEMTAEELAEIEFGPAKGKKGKGKKGGKGKKDEDEPPPAEEAAPAPAPAEEAAASPAPAAADDDEEEGGKKVLSKKEKERLKKEKEKASPQHLRSQPPFAHHVHLLNKEFEAALGTPKGAASPSVATPAEPAAAEPEAGGAKLSKAQRKKMKAAFAGVEETPAEPAPAAAAGGKKGKGKIAALQEAMEARRLAQIEAERKAEEERIRLEEEEKRKEEEAKRKAEEEAARKEREKQRREQLKKDGLLLTAKQKKERAAAEMRRQALIASGAVVAAQGDKGPSAGGSAPKFKYGSKSKGQKGAKAPSTVASDSAPASPAVTEATLPPAPEPAPASPSPAEKPAAKDSWEDSDEEEAAPAAPAQPAVKDDWDASSEEEAPAPAPAKPEPAKKAAAPAPASKGAPAKGTPAKAAAPSKTAPPSKAAPPANGKAKAAPPPAEESEEESEEEDSDEDDSEDETEESSDEELTAAQKEAEKRKAEAAARKAKRIEEAMAARSKDDLRSPICCILGHVDTGKTKLLDKIRQTNVQEGEAGGITQQIGATYFPVDAIVEKTRVLETTGMKLPEFKIPGLLIIDTPGHESFTNLRSRGSSLCNIAVLVVDIMHGLEPQTLESLRLLRDRKTPFIVALNKIDRMFGWEAIPNNAVQDSLKKQKSSVRKEFETRTQETILAFAEQGLNAKLYYENDQPGRIVSLVPTSAITGEGVPDMINLLVSLTQTRMSDKLMYLSEVECTVLEVKVIEGLGTTIDVVLSNGVLREGEKIVLCGLNGPIVTNIRALLTPQPLRELRIKSAYVHHKEVKAALGVKITAPGLEKAIAGSRLLLCGPDDDEDDLREEVMSDLTSLMNFIDKSGKGVCVQASTLGSLEALLDFLKVSKIPVSGINIGPVHKKDVMRCATMLERARELAVILCFDVEVDKEADSLAKEMGIRLFRADIIYHLFDAFTAYNNEMMEAKRRDAAPQAVWPCRLRTIACFAKRDPIILGVDIVDGSLRIGTPLCVVKTDPATGKKEIIRLGKITSLEINHKSMEIVKKSQAGAGVAVKIEHAVYESAKMFGRHFDDKDEVISQITRQSIDVLKDSFRSEVAPEEWLLIKQLKPRLDIDL